MSAKSALHGVDRKARFRATGQKPSELMGHRVPAVD